MGQEVGWAPLSCFVDNSSGICSPIRTRTVCLEPGSDDDRTACIIAARRRLGVCGRHQSPAGHLDTFKRTSQEHRLVWEPSVD
jgi:hypothetical protein